MNHYSKPPRTADHLLGILKERSLSINETDEIFIKDKIRTIGYFRLSGYFGPLQSEKDKFKEGVTFHDILRLYEFDKLLRHLTYKALKQIEIQLRTLLTDICSLSHDSSFWYTMPELFDDKKTKITIKNCEIVDGKLVEQEKQIEVSMYNLLIKEISESVNRLEHSEFMKKFRQEYDSDSPIPSWMIMESISFGKLSRLYALLKSSEEKRRIASFFNVVNYEYLESWLHAFVVLRNTCAHHSRLWNKKVGKDIKMPTRAKHRFLEDTSQERIRKYYGIASCILKIYEKIDPSYFKEFKEEFINLVGKYGIDLNAMGFPENYENNEIWKH